AYDKAIADGVECYRAITDAQIEALQIEAAIAGDKDMVETCERAAAGDLSARAECIVALRPVTEV
ncbi:hypothetical protein M3M33_17685, partial [Loigolactobacillus coryniformis]|uniref:hypothetical protein n=1 Tax=Loigolactobacillus coryniformis TaxID=1610 RepID=UPI00201B1DB2